MNIKCYETDYKNFGRCICLQNEKITLMVTLECGPRIIYFGLNEEENILFEDTDRNFSMDTGEYGTWYAYGGHRIWLAPETVPETYFPDNTPVSYSFDEKTYTLTVSQEVTPFKKQFSIECRFDDQNTVTVINKIKNCDDKPQKFSPWAVTGLTPGGTEYLDLCDKDTGFLPNRVLALWPYSDIHDKRFDLSDDKIVLRQDPNAQKAFKIGVNLTNGEVRYKKGNQVYIKRFDKYDESFNYPDFNCNYETYTNKYFLECELVGDYREYQPQETACITEQWILIREEN